MYPYDNTAPKLTSRQRRLAKVEQQLNEASKPSLEIEPLEFSTYPQKFAVVVRPDPWHNAAIVDADELRAFIAEACDQLARLDSALAKWSGEQ